MTNQQRETTAEIVHRSDELEKIAMEISDELLKDFFAIKPKDTYDIISIMAEERNVAPDKIKDVVVLVMARLYIVLLKNRRNEKYQDENTSTGSNNSKPQC